MCTGKYVSLFELVSHVRAAHYDDENRRYTCVAPSCSRVLTSTASWYKHIITEHAEEYRHNEPPCSMYEDEYNESTDSSVHSDVEVCMEGDGDDVSIDDDDEDVCLACTTEEDTARSSISEEIVGQLLKLKEVHLLSHSAVDEVINLVQMVCDSATSDALAAIIQSNGIDKASSSCKELLCKVESFVSPLATLSTTYRQEAYISKKLPFVVSGNYSYYCGSLIFLIRDQFGMKWEPILVLKGKKIQLHRTYRMVFFISHS